MQGGHDPPPLRGQPGPSANRWPSIAPSPSAHPLPSTSNSPPGSSTASAPKRKAPAKPRKKAKEDGGDPDGELDSAGSGDDDEGGRRAKRARMALSCKEVYSCTHLGPAVPRTDPRAIAVQAAQGKQTRRVEAVGTELTLPAAPDPL